MDIHDDKYYTMPLPQSFGWEYEGHTFIGWSWKSSIKTRMTYPGDLIKAEPRPYVLEDEDYYAFWIDNSSKTSKEDIIKYIITTPNNSNKNVLNDMLDHYLEENRY